MSRLGKYQESISMWLKDKSIINNMTNQSRNILNDLLVLSDHLTAVLCLTVINAQCKKNNIKIHGYYLAAGIDIMMVIAKISGNREYFDTKYGEDVIDNMIAEVNSMFISCVIQNIETLRLSKNGSINNNIYTTCTEYATKYIYQISRKQRYTSDKKVKKTDLLSMKITPEHLNNYKKKNLLSKSELKEDILMRYGSVCKLAIGLGWLLGQGSKDYLYKLERLSNDIALFIKIYDDFKYIERDMNYGKISTNYVVNYGIKEAHIELIESRTYFTENAILLDIYTKTCKEIIDMIICYVNGKIEGLSIDLQTQYDDVSSI